MKQISKLLLIIWLVVITNPYEGINYKEINVYDVNYCSEYCYNQNIHYSDYFEDEEEVEELEDEYRDEYEDDEKPLIFDLDSFMKRK